MTFELSLSSPAVPHDDRDEAFWPTPRAVTRGCYIEHPPPAGIRMAEPSAGSGAIAVELADRGHLVVANELREECRADLEELLPAADGHRVIIGDWLRWTGLPRSFGIMGNPPYNPADEMRFHVAHALALAPVYCALLLPLSFGAALKRAQLLEVYPPAAVRPLVPRPSFAESGEGGKRDVAWHVWRKGDTSARFAPMWWRQYA